MATYIFKALKPYSLTGKVFLLMAQVLRTDLAKEGDPVALISAYWGAVQGVAETYAVHPELPLPESKWAVDIVRK